MAASTSTQAAGPLGVSTIMPTDPYELMHWNMVIGARCIPGYTYHPVLILL